MKCKVRFTTFLLFVVWAVQAHVFVMPSAIAIAASTHQEDMDKLPAAAGAAELRKDFVAAITILTQILRDAQKRGDSKSVAVTLYQIADDYALLGDFNVALTNYNDAIDNFRKLPDMKDQPFWIAKAYQQTGVAYACLSEWESANEWFVRAKSEFFRLQQPSWLVRSIAGEALTLVMQGKEGDAVQIINGYKPIISFIKEPQKVLAGISLGTGLMNLRSYRYKAAYEDFQSAFMYFDKVKREEASAAYCQAGLAASCCGLGEYGEARQHLDAAGVKLGASSTPLERAIMAGIDGMICEGLQDSMGAEMAYQRMQDNYEALSTQIGDATAVSAWLDFLLDPYPRRAALLWKRGQGETGETKTRTYMDALVALERGRARGLARLIGRNANHASALIEQTKFLPKDDDSPMASARGVQLGERLKDPAPATAADLDALAANNSDTLYLEYTVLKDKTLLFALSKNGLQIFPLTGEESIRRLTDAWSKTLKSFGNSVVQKQAFLIQQEKEKAHNLYQMLIMPLEKQPLFDPDQYNHLVIVADGPLQDVPFAALLDSQGHRLFEKKCALSASVSLGMLTRLHRPDTPNQSFLCAAISRGQQPANLNVILENKSVRLPALPDLSKAAADIAGHRKGNVVLAGPDMQKAAVMREMEKHGILIFATHAHVDVNNGLRSWLLMAAQPNGVVNDEILYGREVLNLHLNARMAAIMACDTGIGQKRSGEGVISLAWTFLGAGCPSVLASLWTVDDAASSNLLREFFAELQTGKPKDIALQAAMRRVKQGPFFKAAYFFAPFQVVGDCSPVFP
jgi:CHAT domain-containing protein